MLTRSSCNKSTVWRRPPNRTDPHSGNKQNWKHHESITRAESTADLQAKYEQLWHETAPFFMARNPVVQTTGAQQQAGSKPCSSPSSSRTNKEIDSDVIQKLSQIQVSQYEALVPSLIKYFENKVANLKAGQLNISYSAWKELTSNPEILETVAGQCIEFEQQPVQLNLPIQPNYSC